MTLTDREKAITLVKYIVHGVSPFADAPVDTRVQMLMVASKIVGLKMTEDDLFQIGEEIIKFQGEFIELQREFLKTNKDTIIKTHQELAKGNESVKAAVGSFIKIDEALSLLNKGGK